MKLPRALKWRKPRIEKGRKLKYHRTIVLIRFSHSRNFVLFETNNSFGGFRFRVFSSDQFTPIWKRQYNKTKMSGEEDEGKKKIESGLHRNRKMCL